MKILFPVVILTKTLELLLMMFGGFMTISRETSLMVWDAGFANMLMIDEHLTTQIIYKIHNNFILIIYKIKISL